MNIGHTLEKRKLLRDRYLYVPHECDVIDCPGNRNRLRLELWDEMLAALDYCAQSMAMPEKTCFGCLEEVQRIITKAKDLK